MTWPRIRARSTTTLSPWVNIIAREVEFERGAPPQLYHAIEQHDYISIVALTPDGRIPVVRQYRPALETFTWELPAGLLDSDETPAECCRRELLEETGLTTRAIHRLGTHAPCTGRFTNRVHSFFIETGERIADFKPEPGLTVKFVSPAEIVRMAKSGKLAAQLHVAALFLAELNGFLSLSNEAAPQRRQKRARGR